MPKAGDVVLANVQFVNSPEVKRRPAVVLFEEYGNIVVAGITSNLNMNGIPLLREDGAIKDSVIKTNYIMTLAMPMIVKKLFELSRTKKQELRNALQEKLDGLNG